MEQPRSAGGAAVAAHAEYCGNAGAHPSGVAFRRIQVGLHAALGVAAVGAGQAFVRDPSGNVLGMTPDYLAGSPFPDFRVPGLVLAVVIGRANLLSGFALWRRRPGATLLSLATGVLLVAWVAIQTSIIGFRHWSQAVWWIVFALVTVLGALLVRNNASERGDQEAGPLP